jgi:cobyrinic acid a,c-diamide synthase
MTAAHNPRRVLVSATHKSSGKTTIAVGLARALRERGLAVQAFKKGPDYIDPMWLTAATGRRCRNLDPYLSEAAEYRGAFRRHAATADVCVVEGNKGLYDGLALDGSNSNAALAKALALPVLLVVDARGMTRGVAPLVLGYQAFDRDVRIAGVVLNLLGGSRHEAKLRMVIEHYTDVPVLGAVHADPRLAIAERHLGLTPSNEADGAAERVDTIGRIVGAQLDLDAILGAAALAPPLAVPGDALADPFPPAADADLRIGVVQDRAFGFYYADDLDALRSAGATLVRVDALADAQLPGVDALFIGGGFPELYAAELEANAALRGRIRSAIDAGMPVYAECGGLMYLARTLTYRGQSHRMVGAIPGDVVMHERPVGRGYVNLEETEGFPWGAPGSAAVVRAHEFHHSSIENLPADVRWAYTVKRGHGVDGRRDGIVVNNVLASYAHLRSAGGNAWARRFVDFIRHADYRSRRQGNIVYLPPSRGREAMVV